MPRSLCFATACLALLLGPPRSVAVAEDLELLDYELRLETIVEHDEGDFLWFHPRVAALASNDGSAQVMMTLQKHLHASDYYSGLHVLTTDDGGRHWSDIELPPSLDWRTDERGVTIAVADVTPGWHAPTGKLLAIGAQVRYSPAGEQLDDQVRAHQTAYAVFDPDVGQWSEWKLLEMPDDPKFNFARSACAQWLVEPDGRLLLPFYCASDAKQPFYVTVVSCDFDGRRITFREHGNELHHAEGRGVYEPSLVKFAGEYYLTLRTDEGAYVARGADGLHYEPMQPWVFDDGQLLGSYNTQQHWIAHSDGLLLAYTRRGADNDHVFRHRAPLFLAQVEPQRLQVIRRSERVLVPERGATLGNFGAAAITPLESWVTVSEGVFSDEARQRGATGATFVARIQWATPNQLAPPVKQHEARSQ